MADPSSVTVIIPAFEEGGSCIGSDRAPDDVPAGLLADDPALDSRRGELRKDEAAILTLGAANTYSGDTRIDEGTIRQGIAQAHPDLRHAVSLEERMAGDLGPPFQESDR